MTAPNYKAGGGGASVNLSAAHLSGTTAVGAAPVGQDRAGDGVPKRHKELLAILVGRLEVCTARID